MQDSIHLNIAQCQFDWAELNLQLVPHLAEIGIEITPLPETQGYWWSDLEYKYIPSSPGIYAIANVLNGDFYIGSAANLYQRKLEHVGKLQKNKHRNSHLQNACNLYGANAFRFVIVEHVEVAKDLIEREQYYIDTLNPKYNIRTVADSNLGMKHSEETRRKIGETKKGRPAPNRGKQHSEETRRKISAALKGKPAPNKGKPMSEAQKAKLSLIRKGRPGHNKGKPSHNKGKPMSEEQKAKISEALMGHETSEETKAKMSAALKGKPGHNKGKPMSEETRAKLSAALTGREISEETRVKMSKAHKGINKKPLSPESIAKRTATRKARREADPAYGKKKKAE